MSKVRKRRKQQAFLGKKTYLSALLLFIFLSISSVSVAVIGANIGSIISTAAANAAIAAAKAAAEAAASIAKIGASIGTFSATTVANMTYSMNSQLSSIKVATAQISQSSQALAEVQTYASQKLATVRQTIDVQNRILDVNKSYGAASGQGYKACVVVKENKGLDEAADHTNLIAASKESETLSAITTKSSLNDAIYNKIKLSQAEFCSTGNPNCEPSRLPAGDVNGALLFVPADDGSKEQLARNLFRQNVLGTQVEGLNVRNQINSPQGQMSYFNSNRQAALLSPAAYSLAYIDAQNTRTIERDGKKYSANELIENTVGRYYGGKDAKSWQASMITQEPRGLLVESARIGGLTVWLENHMYQQSLRKEAMLASILLATTTPLSKSVADKGNKEEAKSLTPKTALFK
ncbi:hypothetical protein A7M79_00110 [Acinetobacter baumannii]|uniref:hypothetical protein n=1 Tax=Acinetobacter baumannii TaxID=470 RepID=UPI0008DC6A2B|nr:hypothetical protein [Acinetobacter baumannii]OIH11926.1 hypothetical protein A7M79_00110 [Acinetobacter baumannii]